MDMSFSSGQCELLGVGCSTRYPLEGEVQELSPLPFQGSKAQCSMMYSHSWVLLSWLPSHPYLSTLRFRRFNQFCEGFLEKLRTMRTLGSTT